MSQPGLRKHDGARAAACPCSASPRCEAVRPGLRKRCGTFPTAVATRSPLHPVFAPARSVDDRGRLLTAAALLHRNAFRMRCPSCSSTFCTGCGAFPFHLGADSCEAYAAHLRARKCRFCDDALPVDELLPQGGSGAGGAAASAGGAAARLGLAGKRRRKAAAASADSLPSTCAKAECQAKAAGACLRVHDECGHPCGGIRAECADDVPAAAACLPCLHADCASRTPGLQQTGDDFCNICWVESLSAAPAVRLECGHVFHEACVSAKVGSGFQSHRLTFAMLQCPLCKGDMVHWALRKQLQPLLDLKARIEAMARGRLSFEGIDKDPAVVNAGGQFFKKPLECALDRCLYGERGPAHVVSRPRVSRRSSCRFCYYRCAKCQQPYFGGLRACGPAGPAAADDRGGGAGAAPAAPPGAAAEAAELICPGCQVMPPGTKGCDKHGKGTRRRGEGGCLRGTVSRDNHRTAHPPLQNRSSGSAATVAAWRCGFAGVRPIFVSPAVSEMSSPNFFGASTVRCCDCTLQTKLRSRGAAGG